MHEYISNFVPYGGDFVLIKALKPGYGESGAFVNFLTFRARLESEIKGWESLYELGRRFIAACESRKNCGELSRLAKQSYDFLVNGQRNVYREWYNLPDTPPAAIEKAHPPEKLEQPAETASAGASAQSPTSPA